MKRCVLIALVMIISAAMAAKASSEPLSHPHLMKNVAGILLANGGQAHSGLSFESYMSGLVVGTVTPAPGSHAIALEPDKVSDQEVDLQPIAMQQLKSWAETHHNQMNGAEEEEEEENDEGDEEDDKDEEEGEAEGWDRMWDAPKLA